MRAFCARVLRAVTAHLARLADWCDPLSVVTLTVPKDALYATARLLVAQAERQKVNGERKRHQVWAALEKHFPQASGRALAHAIEAAVETETRG